MPDPKKKNKKRKESSIYDMFINSLEPINGKEKAISAHKSKVNKRNTKEEKAFAENLLSESLRKRKEYEDMLTKHASAYKTDPNLKKQVLDKINTIDSNIKEYSTTIDNNTLPKDVTQEWANNTFNNEYGLGGALSGGLSGAGTGAQIGSAFGPIGTIIGGGAGLLMGGLSGHLGEKKQDDALAAQQDLQKQQMSMMAQSQYDSQMNGFRVDAYNNSVNNVINPVAQGYAFGGMINPFQGEGALFNETNMNTFGNGGTHEQSPHGGIPQGMGENGKMNTVEEGETSISLGKGQKYVFSDRLIFNSI